MEKFGGSLATLLNWGTDLLSTVFEVAGYPFKQVVNWFNGTAASVVSGAMSAAKKIVVGIILFVIILWVAVFLYASFYRIFVPAATIVRPAHFKFRVCPSGVGMCSFPMANVTLGTGNKAEVLGLGQEYRVLLDMQVPDSVANRDIGMFMVIIRMFDRYGVITQESSRAVSLKFQSDLLKIIQTVVFAPLYITGFMEEIQTLNIDLFGKFWDDYYRPSVGALVEIHSRQLMFYSAKLHFHASYGGLRYYLYHYPLSCALLGILFNCLWLTPTVLIPWYTLGIAGGTDLNDQTVEQERMDAGAEDGCGDVRRRDNEGWADVGPLGQDEGEVEMVPDRRDETEVETVPAYFHQPFTMATLTPPSPPSQGSSDDVPQLTSASKSGDDHECAAAATLEGDRETARKDSSL